MKWKPLSWVFSTLLLDFCGFLRILSYILFSLISIFLEKSVYFISLECSNYSSFFHLPCWKNWCKPSYPALILGNVRFQSFSYISFISKMIVTKLDWQFTHVFSRQKRSFTIQAWCVNWKNIFKRRRESSRS